MVWPLTVCLCFVLLTCQDFCMAKRKNLQNNVFGEPGHGDSRKYYKLGEFNDRCRATRDCRHFGYVCRDNKTCQCDYMYVPDVNQKICVGGVNQRCIYDEHCIDGAFCMNQEVCKCKENSPVELEDGLMCTDGQAFKNGPSYWNFLLVVLFVL